ncbi:hypothetical protein ACWFRM_23240 [Streptomyces sp. NPDC055144]
MTVSGASLSWKRIVPSRAVAMLRQLPSAPPLNDDFFLQLYELYARD